MDELSQEDKYILRGNYDRILSDLKPRDIVTGLNNKDVLSPQDITKLNSPNITEEQITEYLVFQLLITTGTYTLLKTLKQVLIDCQNEQILEFLPEDRLPGNDVQKESDGTAEHSINRLNKDTDGTLSQGNIANITAGGSDESGNNSEGDDDDQIVKTAGIRDLAKSVKKKLSVKKKHDKTKLVNEDKKDTNCNKDKSDICDTQTVEAAKSPRVPIPRPKKITQFADAFLNYESKEPSSRYGRGLCVIFALFTGDLVGYKYDVPILEEFFGSLDYRVWSGQGFENLKKEELFHQISRIRHFIKNNPEIDRLVVVILTHGTEDGLMTCADKNGIFDERVATIYQYVDGRESRKVTTEKTQIKEIVDCFKHDTVPSLKDMPKLFLVQACRGSDIVQAANVVNATNEDIVDGQIDTSALRFNPVLPIDADIMICQAATKNHSSLVNPYTGSWFIQQTIEVFKRHYKSQHVADMMTVVNLSVAELRGRIEKEGEPTVYARQMPCIFSTFRKRFYLCNQNQESTVHLPRLNQNYLVNREHQPHYV